MQCMSTECSPQFVNLVWGVFWGRYQKGNCILCKNFHIIGRVVHQPGMAVLPWLLLLLPLKLAHLSWL